MPRFLFLTIGLPTLVSAVVVFLGALLARRHGKKLAELPPWAGPLAVAAAFVTGVPGVLGSWPDLAPKQGEVWLFHLAIAAGIVGILLAAARSTLGRSLPASLAAAAALTALLIALPLRAAVERGMGTGTTRALGLAAIAAAVILPIALAEITARRTKGPGPALALWLALTASSIAIILSPSAKLGQLAALLSMGTGWLMLAAIFARAPLIAYGTLVTALTLHAGVWLTAHFYADAHWSAAALGLFAPAATAVALLPPIARLGPWARTIIQSLATLIPATAAVALEYANRPPPNPYG